MIAFMDCGAGGPGGIGSGAPAARRRDVVVSGKRVKTVDVHAHCGLPEATALMGLKFTTDALLMATPGDRLHAMDQQGIDVERSASTPSGTERIGTWPRS
jgi:aminocarboxymuconate-semialdehyde decarboxylase